MRKKRHKNWRKVLCEGVGHSISVTLSLFIYLYFSKRATYLANAFRIHLGLLIALPCYYRYIIAVLLAQ